MTTIVVIVLSVTLLILGIVFVRNFMCSGIQLTDTISESLKNQLNSIFGANDYGVVCMGEGNQEIKIGTGGRRKIICIVKTEEQAEYEITVKNVEVIKGPKSSVPSWILDKNWKGSVSPGGDGVQATILLLDIPRTAPVTELKLTITAKNINSGAENTIISYIEIVPVGFIKKAMC